MKYIFLAYRNEKLWVVMSAGERDALEQACQTNEHDLWQRNHLIAVEGLPSNHTAITVQIVDGRVYLTGGPLAKTQGPLIRLFFIQAKDLNEAIRLASTMPQARLGPIEVRPVIEFK